MKIPNSKLYCQFKYCIQVQKRAKSINEVPYWRLYIVKRWFIDTPYGRKSCREIIDKSTHNLSFDEICEQIRSLGKPFNNLKEKGVSYFYEAWARKTRNNRKI